jgi:hypothetical protein
VFNEEQLSADGQNYAFIAMQAYLRADADLFGLHAGVAAERLAKACLARRSPALLVELQANSFSSLAMLLGLSVVERPGRRSKVRTVGLQTAFDRLHALGVQVDVSRDSLENFIEARNWSTHGGLGGFELQETAADFVKIVDSLLVDLNFDRYSFWHVHLAAADSLKDGAEQRHRERVAKLLSAAAARFEALSEAEQSERQEMAAVLMFAETKHSRFQCPACGNLGVLSGEYRTARSEERPDAGIEWVLLEVDEFSCHCCALRLKGRADIYAGSVIPTVSVAHDEALAHVFASDPEIADL